MKNVSAKIAYMVIGSILTLIGYHFGNIENNTAEAQKEDATVDEIRCRRFVLVDDDNVPRVVIETKPDGNGSIAIGNQNGMKRLLLTAGVSDGMEAGSIEVYQEDEDIITTIGSDANGGYMTIYNHPASQQLSNLLFI